MTVLRKPLEALSAAQRLLVRKLIGVNDEDGRLPSTQMPDSISARLSVFGGTEEALNEEPLANREIVFSNDGRMVVGDGTRYGGEDFLRKHSLINRIGGHVPGNITLVSGKTSGTIGITCTTSAGSFGVLWWDNTISTAISGGSVSKAVTSPTADWATAPKMIRVFPLTAGESLTEFVHSGGDMIEPAAIDLRGASLTRLTIQRASIEEFVAPTSIGVLGINQSPNLKFLDISGLAASSIQASTCDALAIIRAVGMTATSTVDIQHTGGTGSLSATALNRVFHDLGNAAGTIFVYGHPGTAACDATIATAKGWTVMKTFV